MPQGPNEDLIFPGASDAPPPSGAHPAQVRVGDGAHSLTTSPEFSTGPCRAGRRAAHGTPPGTPTRPSTLRRAPSHSLNSQAPRRPENPTTSPRTLEHPDASRGSPPLLGELRDPGQGIPGSPSTQGSGLPQLLQSPRDPLGDPSENRMPHSGRGGDMKPPAGPSAGGACPRVHPSLTGARESRGNLGWAGPGPESIPHPSLTGPPPKIPRPSPWAGPAPGRTPRLGPSPRDPLRVS